MTLEEITAMALKTKEQTNVNTANIDSILKRIDKTDDLVASVKLLASEQGHMKNDISEIKGDLKTIAEKPAKRWDTVITAVLTTLVGFFLGLLLNGMT